MDDEALTTRVCELLGRIPSFEYPATAATLGIAVFYGRIDDAPDRAVGVRVYGVTDEQHLHWRRVQIRVRGGKRKRRDADQIAGVVFTALHGLSRVGGISGIRRDSMTPLGADLNGRDERTENYTIILDNPEATS